MTHKLNQVGYQSVAVAEVWVSLATDTTVYSSRWGEAHKVNKLTVALSLRHKQVPRLFKSLYDGVNHTLADRKGVEVNPTPHARNPNPRMLVRLAVYDSGYVSLEYLLLSWYPSITASSREIETLCDSVTHKLADDKGIIKKANPTPHAPNFNVRVQH